MAIGVTLGPLLATCRPALKEGDVNDVSTKVAVSRDSSIDNSRNHLSTRSSIRSLLTHPAFAGFGDSILPRDDYAYDENMPLSDIASLLPYHSHVDPGTAVNALNRMIDDVNDGNRVFYRFYPQNEIQASPSKATTGLFFFRGRPGAPFAVIAPGGGFSYVASLHEGFPYALEISNSGYNAFVLRYRTGRGGAVATKDLAAAVSYIFSNSGVLGVGTDGYSLWGSSAGARMAAAIGSQGVANFGGKDLPRPSTIVMAYTAHSETASDDPPTFVVVGEHDSIAPPSVMESRVAALRRNGTVVEYHEYRDLGHGFGLATGTSAEGWTSDAIRFWESFIRKGK